MGIPRRERAVEPRAPSIGIDAWPEALISDQGQALTGTQVVPLAAITHIKSMIQVWGIVGVKQLSQAASMWKGAMP